MSHFGATLKLLRTDAGFSLRQLAQRVGVSSAYLSRVEHGHDQPPTPDRLVAIAHALGASPTLLLDLADRVGPFVSNYLAEVPAANQLFLDVARRGLRPVEIARIKAFIDREFPDEPAGAADRAPRLTKLLATDRVLLGLHCSHLDDAIDMAATLLGGDKRGEVPRLAQLMRDREAAAPSTLGDCLAAPHAKLNGSSPKAALVTLAEPLAVPTPDGKPLRALVALVLGSGERAELDLLGQVAKLASQPVVEDLCRATHAREALKVIETQLP